jgi:beta-phosphoglucomutase
MIQAIVFDFDGVLADSEPMHLRAYQAVFAPLGVTIADREYYTRYLGFDDESAIRAMARDHGLELDERQLRELIATKTATFDRMLGEGDVLYPGAVECVGRLAGAFPLGIASGALRHEIEAILRGNRLGHHFRFIVAAGDTPAGKPAADPYRRAAELHGRDPSACLAIEDSRWGIESAKGAGMKCVGITNTYPAHELSAADAVIGSLEEFTEEFIRRL